MPTYAYACTQCNHAFDAVQSFSEASLTVCPECGGGLRKQYGSIGVTFNGGGFYRTDSRAASGKGSAESSASPASTSASASSSYSGGTTSAATSS